MRKLSKEAIEVLKKKAGVTIDVDCQMDRISRWAMDVSLVKGLAVHAKFRVNVRTGEVKRLL